MEQQKKESQIISHLIHFIKWLFVVTFPIFTLLKINIDLDKAYLIENDPWFLKQKKRNIFIGLLLPMPLLLSILIAYINLIINETSTKVIKLFIQNLLELNIIKTYKIIIWIFEKGILNNFFLILALGFISTLIIGTYVKNNLNIIKDTKKLKTLLIKNGIFDEKENKLALATPVGYLIDITGHRIEDLKHNERIWMAMNIKIKEAKEHPDRRSIVLFLKKFELKNVYKYDKDFFSQYLKNKGIKS